MTPDPHLHPETPEPARAAASPWHVPAAPASPAESNASPRRWRVPGGRRVAMAGVIGLIVAGLAAASLHVIGPGERAVVSVLGRPAGQLGPGLALTWPWPVAQVAVYPVGAVQTLVLTAPGDDALVPTADGQLIAPAVEVRWRITAPEAHAAALAAPEAALRDLVGAELRAAIGQAAFDPLWDGSGRPAVAQKVRQRVQAALDRWHAGIGIERIAIVEANPPAALAQTFRKLSEADAEARSHRDKASEWAARTLDNARAEARDFEQIHRQYLAAPEITRRRMYYETMDRVIANNDRVVAGGTDDPAPVTAKAKQP